MSGTNGTTGDPHHCKCFTILKPSLWEFERRMRASGYHEPMLEEDHGQYCSFAKRISEYWQIHIKLKTSGRMEAEIEPPQDYPMAHLNSNHSYSAHNDLSVLLAELGIPFTCRRTIPFSCTQPVVLTPLQPTHRNDFLTAGLTLAALDLGFGDGNTTRRVANTILEKAAKLKQKKMKRRKVLFDRMGWQYPYGMTYGNYH
jgi:hypothetical protein